MENLAVLSPQIILIPNPGTIEACHKFQEALEVLSWDGKLYDGRIAAKAIYKDDVSEGGAVGSLHIAWNADTETAWASYFFMTDGTAIRFAEKIEQQRYPTWRDALDQARLMLCFQLSKCGKQEIETYMRFKSMKLMQGDDTPTHIN